MINFFIGVDTADLDDNTGFGAAVVIKAYPNGTMEIVDSYQSRNREDFAAKIKELADKYPCRFLLEPKLK